MMLMFQLHAGIFVLSASSRPEMTSHSMLRSLACWNQTWQTPVVSASPFAASAIAQPPRAEHAVGAAYTIDVTARISSRYAVPTRALSTRKLQLGAGPLTHRVTVFACKLSLACLGLLCVLSVPAIGGHDIICRSANFVVGVKLKAFHLITLCPRVDHACSRGTFDRVPVSDHMLQ